MNADTTPKPRSDYDAVIVGAGFAGLYMLHRLRGLGLSVRVFEAGGGVGGTWYWNRYPGARCDVESMEYSYQFSDELQQEWEWTERYAPQAEILSYLNHVADRFELRPDIQFDTRVEALAFDEDSGKWTVTTSDGGQTTARFCVLATGCLSSPNLPQIKGMKSFGGATYHTAKWPHDGVHFDGQRVAVIGTGSSGVQSIPVIAKEAGQLFVFQRTPVYSVPAQQRQARSGLCRQGKGRLSRLSRRILVPSFHVPCRAQQRRRAGNRRSRARPGLRPVLATRRPALHGLVQRPLLQHGSQPDGRRIYPGQDPRDRA